MKIIILLACVSLWNCILHFDNYEYYAYTRYSPIYESLEDYENSLGQRDEVKMDSIGRIYHYGDYQILNEVNKGIYIIDNRNPDNPNTWI